MIKYIRSKAGVTLVELVIVVSLLALITTVLVTFFYSGTRIFHDGENQVLIQREARFISEYIKKELRNATVIEIVDKNQEPDEKVSKAFTVEENTFKKILEKTPYYITGAIVEDIVISPEQIGSRVILDIKIIAISSNQEYVLNYKLLLNNLNQDYFDGMIGDEYSLIEHTVYYGDIIPEDDSILEIDYSEMFEMAVFAGNNITLGGSSKIQGNVGTNAVNDNAVSLGWSTEITGDVYIGPEGDENVVINTSGNSINNIVTGSVYQLDSIKEFDMPDYPIDLPEHPDSESGNLHIGPWPTQTFTLTSDGYYDSITVSQGGSLTIDTGDSDRILVVDNLGLDNSGNIELTGAGRLLLYVTSFNGMTGSTTINSDSDPNKLLMFVQDESVVLSGNTIFKGGIYAPNSSVEILNSSRVIGAIIAKEFDGGLGDRIAVEFQDMSYK